VSNPINIYNPGCKDQIVLISNKKVFEFSYKTEIFLASKEDYAYTKITTITPLYVIINNTLSYLFVAQEGSEYECMKIEVKQRMAFNWSDKDKPRRVSVQIPGYNWSSGFMLAEVGTICVQINNNKDGAQEIISAF
jgi:hypothetical protein